MGQKRGAKWGKVANPRKTNNNLKVVMGDANYHIYKKGVYNNNNYVEDTFADENNQNEYKKEFNSVNDYDVGATHSDTLNNEQNATENNLNFIKKGSDSKVLDGVYSDIEKLKSQLQKNEKKYTLIS